MKNENKLIRHEAIKNAAYELLASKGYDGASMLSIAKAAKASNETLYRWYGDKKGLFERLIEDNAAQTKKLLADAIVNHHDPYQTLEKVSPILLTMLLGERAILLNRAAAAEPTGELGVLISSKGRDIIQPLFENLMQKLVTGQDLSPRQVTALYLGLLIGDLQIKRVIGTEKIPTEAQVEERVNAALSSLKKLLS